MLHSKIDSSFLSSSAELDDEAASSDFARALELVLALPAPDVLLLMFAVVDGCDCDNGSEDDCDAIILKIVKVFINSDRYTGV